MSDYVIQPEIFEQNMNILIYGDPGAGKTHLAGTAQDHEGMRNVKVFNIDGGMLTLAGRRDIRAQDIDSMNTLETELYKIANGDKTYKDIRTIVIDNITELQTLSIFGIINNKNKNKGKQSVQDIDEVFIEDYGKATKQLARILRQFRDLPCNKIYIAHRRDKTRKTADGRVIIEETKPNLMDKLCTAVSGYMDFVWYLYYQTVNEKINGQDVPVTHRYLLTQPLNSFLAKTRGHEFAQALGAIVTDPTMDKIYDTYLKVSSTK